MTNWGQGWSWRRLLLIGRFGLIGMVDVLGYGCALTVFGLAVSVVRSIRRLIPIGFLGRQIPGIAGFTTAGGGQVFDGLATFASGRVIPRSLSSAYRPAAVDRRVVSLGEFGCAGIEKLLRRPRPLRASFS